MTKQPYAKDPANLKLTELTDHLAGLGLSGREVAELIGFSPGQLSRLMKGERRASFQKHLQPLREKARQLTIGRMPRSAFSIDHGVLSRLSATEAVAAFRDLLWAKAAERGNSTTTVNVSSEVFTPDGGVDASIVEAKGPIFGEGQPSSKFQIKTGQFEPWHESQIKKELFGKKARGFEHLGPAVQRCLREGNRFILVCFGVDPVDEKLCKARENLASAFTACGFPNASIDVWGQTHLIGLFQRYPSLCLRLLGHDHEGFRSHASWAQDTAMAPQVHYSPEQQLLVEELRNDLKTSRFPHLRLIGEPGVGKTRLALELTRADDLAPVTLYVRDGQSLLRSSFLNELIQIDDHRFLVLVVDECLPKDRAEIWNILGPRSNRVRVISIDHGPEQSFDEKMRIVPVKAVGSEQIVAILKDHGIAENDAKRWAEHCHGCPRVAHVLGENLRLNHADLLQAPASVNVWDRFIVGYDPAESEEVQLRKIVLRHIALFERFGFEPPVDAEAKFIAAMAMKCDPRLTWPRFQSIVRNLKERRIVQGAKTLYLTPRLLHFYLYRDFWQIYGSGFEVGETLKTMPSELWHWFVQMLRYANELEAAERAVESLLSRHGLFPGNEFPNDGASGDLIGALAETSRKPTLRCLQRTIGSMGIERLRELTAPRQSLVWALEKIAVWEDCFVEAAELLLSLAEAENANYSNNSTGTFTNLFSLVPGFSPTQASASIRLTVLQSALASESQEKRRIGLAACAAALSDQIGGRSVGPEHQGLRKTIPFWIPKTYGELWDAHRDVWQLLVDKLQSWNGDDRHRLLKTLVGGAWTMLQIDKFAPLVIDTLKMVAKEPLADIKEIVALIKRQLHFNKGNLSLSVRNELNALSQQLDGHDFPSRLRRFVKHATWEDHYDDKHNRTKLVEERLDELAKAASADPDLLRLELNWIVREDSSAAFYFGYIVAKHDSHREFLSHIVAHQTAQKEAAAVSFLSGYLNSIFDQNLTEWESVMLSIAENPSIGDRFSDFVIGSGMSDRIAEKVVEQCRSGAQGTERLEHWWSCGRLSKLSVEVIEKLVRFQIGFGSGQLWSKAVHMCHTYFFDKDEAKPLPEKLLFEVLTHERMGDGRTARSASFYWSRLADAFVRQYPSRAWELFRSVLRSAAKDCSLLIDLNTNRDQLLTRLLRQNPEIAWDCITETFRNSGEQHKFALQSWLADGGRHFAGDSVPGPIEHIPATKLFEWVDENVDERGYWLARVVPKTLDMTKAGRLTREFVARYGRHEGVFGTLTAHFYSRGWCGNDSDHYRGLREEAHEWLVGEKDATVKRWIENYIDGLTYQIQRAEIDEERRF